MTDVLFVDWLGRGGIAQTTEAFARCCRQAGLEVAISSRSGSSLPTDRSVSKRLPGPVGVVEVHRRLASATCSLIRERRPATVYLQNYWLPPLETRVVEASRDVGARVVLAMHNDEPHQLRAGVAYGLRSLVRGVDEIVVHSEHVGRRVLQRFGRAVRHVGLPLQVSLLESEPVSVPELTDVDGARVALTFGILGRRYKGLSTLQAVSGHRPGWCMVAAGVGASSATGFDLRVDRFLDDAELHWVLQRSTASLLPYRAATQSAAVLLAQALGAPPIVPAVGGIVEQVVDRVDGYLLPVEPRTDDWLRALDEIDADPTWWAGVTERGRASARERGHRAERAFVELIAGAT